MLRGPHLWTPLSLRHGWQGPLSQFQGSRASSTCADPPPTGTAEWEDRNRQQTPGLLRDCGVACLPPRLAAHHAHF